MSSTPTVQKPSFFETALPIAHILPLDFEGGTLSIVWVGDTGQWPTLAALNARLAARGEQAARFTQPALHRALGHTLTHWILAGELFPDTFFLHLDLDAPAVRRPFLKLTALRAECLIRLDLAREETGPLLNSMAASRSFFLRFDAGPPAWVAPGSPLRAEDERLDALLLSSLPINFNAEGITLIRRQFEAWRAARGAE